MEKKFYQSPEAEIEMFTKTLIFTESGPDFDGTGDDGDTEF